MQPNRDTVLNRLVTDAANEVIGHPVGCTTAGLSDYVVASGYASKSRYRAMLAGFKAGQRQRSRLVPFRFT
jgi:hypothetical protein